MSGDSNEQPGIVQKDDWFRGIAEAAKWPLAVGFLVSFLGLFLLLKYEPSTLFWKVVYAGITELGFAFVIAWIVLATLEVRARDAHEKEVMERREEFEGELLNREKILNKNIFDYIYSVRLPKDIFLSIEKNIFQSPFVKDYQRIDYHFEEVKKGWVLIRGEFEYEIRNVSREKKPFDIKFYIEKELGDAPPPFVQKGFYKVIVDGEHLSTEDIQAADEEAEDTVEYTNFKLVKKLSPDQTMKVVLGFHLRKRTTDSEIWQSLDTCSHLDVKISYDPREFDLHVTTIHPNDEFTAVDKDDYGVRVEMSEPLLRGNGVYLWWASMGGHEEPKQLTRSEDMATHEERMQASD
ncbi:hypothetical protein [Ruegeria sp. HKCCSP346]|uniref:hypothetical protein n=1 Tax=Ruegeria sp. HKCCSP346 TaxID=2794830 RepID=UPI001AE649D8|nr:hypothetical protein [Ruegeria sp. HKCCSP346]